MGLEEASHRALSEFLAGPEDAVTKLRVVRRRISWLLSQDSQDADTLTELDAVASALREQIRSMQDAGVGEPQPRNGRGLGLMGSGG